ncbi:MAG: DNA recombination/repair protein RecA, partial [Candidatus Lindowbacteria bacterium]|nr:DNA recombination/repair protein RecA [Candidatus Lindowbacteria bacterium]
MAKTKEITKTLNTKDPKAQALLMAMDQIQKDFGKGSIMRLGDSGSAIDVETVTTGLLAL